MTHVELLYLDGCPNHEPLQARVRELLVANRVHATVEAVPVGTDEEARRRRFLGSPTLRVDGSDVEPGADQRTDFGIKCRLFVTSEGVTGVPADAWVRAALERGRAPLATAGASANAPRSWKR
jgi:hypothetical protein